MERIADAFIAARPEVVYADNTATVNYAEANTARDAPWGMRHKRGRRRNVAVDEKDLNPGDTKLLDDFLDSFKRPMMQMGG